MGFNCTFFPQFVMGSHGMVRRYATYMPEFQPYHVISSIGAFTQMAAFLLMAAYLLYSLYGGRRRGQPVGRLDPGMDLHSPPPHDNFETQPIVGEPYDHSGLVWNEAVGGYERREGMKDEGCE